jgi:hypothetical protein
MHRKESRKNHAPEDPTPPRYHLAQGQPAAVVPRRRQRQPEEHGPVGPGHRGRRQQRGAQGAVVQPEAPAAVEDRHAQVAAQRDRLEPVPAVVVFVGCGVAAREREVVKNTGDVRCVCC